MLYGVCAQLVRRWNNAGSYSWHGPESNQRQRRYKPETPSITCRLPECLAVSSQVGTLYRWAGLYRWPTHATLLFLHEVYDGLSRHQAFSERKKHCYHNTVTEIQEKEWEFLLQLVPIKVQNEIKRYLVLWFFSIWLGRVRGGGVAFWGW